MVDLFKVHDYITYLNNSYPGLKISVRYDFATFTLYIQIEPRSYYKNVEYYSGQSSVSDTSTCISHISDAFSAYLAYLSHMRIKL